MFFSNFWIRQYFWKFCPKVPKKWFLAKNHVFWLFWSKFSKILLNSKIWKKCSQSCILTWFSGKFSIFNSKFFFFSLSQTFLTKNVGFCHFLKKSEFLVKFYIKNGFSDSFAFQKCILLIYITITVWKLQHSICFKKIWVHTPLKKVNCSKLWFLTWFFHL